MTDHVHGARIFHKPDVAAGYSAEFAKLNKWRPSPPFSFRELAGLERKTSNLDDFNRVSGRTYDFDELPIGDQDFPPFLDNLSWWRAADRRPVAIITQPDDHLSESEPHVQSLAKRYGLIVAKPRKKRAGWYAPGHVEIFAIVKPNTPVLWLREQYLENLDMRWR